METRIEKIKTAIYCIWFGLMISLCILKISGGTNLSWLTIIMIWGMPIYIKVAFTTITFCVLVAAGAIIILFEEIIKIFKR